MLLRKIYILSLFLLLPMLALSQSFTGVVMDSKSGTPLPYANIGVRGKNLGGIADIRGHFQIDLSKSLPTDTVVISYLGYQSQTFLKRNIGGIDYKIELISSALQLQEVVAIGKREVVTIGNKKASGHFTGWGDYSSSKGRLRGIAIETDKWPLKLTTFNLYLDACEFDSVRFRLHILPLLVNHSGDLQIESLKENIFFTARKGQKRVHVDLTPYNLIINQNSIVAVEWVDAWTQQGGSHLLTIATSREEGYTYTRDTPEVPFQVVYYKFTPTMYFEAYSSNASRP